MPARVKTRMKSAYEDGCTLQIHYNGYKIKSPSLSLGDFIRGFRAVPTGFGPAISALTGPHVWPLHHGTLRPVVYYTIKKASSIIV